MSNITNNDEPRKAAYTSGEWSRHTMTDVEPSFVKSPDGKEWFYADVIIGSGDKIIAEVKYSTANAGYPSVDDHSEFLANASLLLAAPSLLKALQNLAMFYEPQDRSDAGALADAKSAIAKALGQ